MTNLTSTEAAALVGGAAGAIVSFIVVFCIIFCIYFVFPLITQTSLRHA